MEYKEIDNIINSQINFNKSNSNSVNYRIQILNSLLSCIDKNEEKIYDALKEDLNKHEFESFLSFCQEKSDSPAKGLKLFDVFRRKTSKGP